MGVRTPVGSCCWSKWTERLYWPLRRPWPFCRPWNVFLPSTTLHTSCCKHQGQSFGKIVPTHETKGTTNKVLQSTASHQYAKLCTNNGFNYSCFTFVFFFDLGQ